MSKSPPDLIALMAQILVDTPKMPDAACIGRHELFDPPVAYEDPGDVLDRHTAAVGICSTCPARTRCRQWATTERPTDGVLAGQIPPQPQRRGRPPQMESA
ncbi:MULTISPECIES: WhiB family transcriptional regulator [Actinomycetes]|uniref:WhiB family transcriptional regulator n=1 Tax=Actinomycetes TaxID=1760 RepID=UPI0004C00204|nr:MULTISPECIES: WhiB family transcriptional regulator [Actinomycetes]